MGGQGEREQEANERKQKRHKGRGEVGVSHWSLSTPDSLVLYVLNVIEGDLHMLILCWLHVVLNLRFWLQILMLGGHIQRTGMH